MGKKQAKKGKPARKAKKSGLGKKLAIIFGSVLLVGGGGCWSGYSFNPM